LREIARVFVRILEARMQAEVIASTGNGAPLVYVPGIDGSGELLLGAAERLARRFFLVRLRYGGDEGGDYATLAASVAECLAQVPGGRALVLAESFGVAVALRTAIDHPERVAGLALVNGFARFRGRFGLALTRGVFALAPRAWIHAGRARFAQRGLIAPRRDPTALQALLALRGDWFDARYRARLAWIQRLDLRAELARVSCPVSLFAADHDRVVDALAAAREMAQSLGAAELTVLPRAGHLVLPLAEEPWVERLEHLARRAKLA
jgi:pimeloyl-ACP methyl ester carboxylesterase